MQPEAPDNLSIKDNLKLGTFHIGSTMADVLGSGVWNRIMIDNLGYAATPVGFLLALRYFMVPLALWSGEKSDQPGWRGYRRLPWIWLGRLMMIGGYILIAFSTIGLVEYGSFGWSGLVIGFVIVSIGYSISGSTFLALVYDRAPVRQRGRAVGIVWTFLIAGYAISGILFSRLLPDFEESRFLIFFVVVGVIMFLIWLFALWGEEKPVGALTSSSEVHPTWASTKHELVAIWQNSQARLLGLFIILSFLAGFMQDAVLEPYGGTVFGLPVEETTRFQAYWGTMAILSSMASLWAYRRFSGYSYRRYSQIGVILLIVTFILLVVATLTVTEAILRPALLLLGLGYGLWNIGTLGLMVENSREEKAGFDLGVWTVVTTLSRGGAILLGAVLFDLFARLLNDRSSAYAVVFGVEVLLLLGSLAVLAQMEQSKSKTVTVDNDLVLSAAVD